VTVVVALAAPPPAAAVGPHSDCGTFEFGCKINEWIWEASGLDKLSEVAADQPSGPKQHGAAPLLRSMVTMPQYADVTAEPKVLGKLSLMKAMALGLVPLLLCIHAVRSYIAGFMGTNSASAIVAPARAAVVVGGIAIYDRAFDQLQNLTDAVSITLVGSSEDSFSKLLNMLNPPWVNLNPLWFLLIVAFFIFVLLFMKIVLGAMLGIFFLLGPIAMALWILDETAWVGRSTLQGAFGVLLFGPVAGVVFLLWGVVEPNDLGTDVPLLIGLGNGFFALGSIYLLYKIPITVVKQAGFGAGVPSPSRLMMGLALTRFIARGGAGNGRAPAPQPTPGPRPGFQYTSPSGVMTNVQARTPGGAQPWSVTQGGVTSGLQLAPPTGRHRPRQEREPNIQRTGGAPLPGGGRHAAGVGRHRATDRSVARRGVQFNQPVASGSTTAEARRFNELPAGMGPAPPGSLASHGAGTRINTLPADGARPQRDYYEPTGAAKAAGFRGNIVRETYAGGVQRWRVDYQNPLNGWRGPISGPEMGYVLHGTRT
jgi:hypothetical protein